jgi:hypothetical protein
MTGQFAHYAFRFLVHRSSRSCRRDIGYKSPTNTNKQAKGAYRFPVLLVPLAFTGDECGGDEHAKTSIAPGDMLS